MARTTKTKEVDSGFAVEDEFRYSVDLTIDPPLPDTIISKMSRDHFKLKQIKDEDVQLIDGEIVVVSRNATTVEAASGEDDYMYGYTSMKKNFQDLVQTVTANGSTLTGQVLVWHAQKMSHFIRLLPVNGKVEVQAANLSWPDGTSSVMPTKWRELWD